MNITTRQYTYPRTTKSGEVAYYTSERKYKTKENTNYVGKQKCRDKITTCSDEEQMQKLLAYMESIGI
jgi:hypothetical protein